MLEIFLFLYIGIMINANDFYFWLCLIIAILKILVWSGSVSNK